MAEIPFWKGKDVNLLVTFIGEKLLIDHVDLEITREGEEIQDDICGEDRSRLDFVTDYFGVVINAKQQKTDLIKAFVAEQKSRDAREIPKGSAIGILIKPNDATLAAFQCREYILGKWKFGYSSRKERNKVSLPGRCRYIDPVPTIG